ncbi:MAG: AI-2E family transporter [Myxococcales bacterium]|nr:MAG: AI-2E family transporter [Myxococcales bacterium]
MDLSTSRVASKLSELAGKAGTFSLSSLSAATQGTAAFSVNLFVMLYAMFYFLREGPAVRATLLRYLPLPDDVEERLEKKGASVVRATIKGTFIVGILQGTLGGIAFTIAGIDGGDFWATLMAVCSVIPAIGTALVWVRPSSTCTPPARPLPGRVCSCGAPSWSDRSTTSCVPGWSAATRRCPTS